MKAHNNLESLILRNIDHNDSQKSYLLKTLTSVYFAKL